MAKNGKWLRLFFFEEEKNENLDFAAAPQIRGHFFRGAGSPPSSDCLHSSYHTPICGFVVGFAQKLKGLRPRRNSDCHTRTNAETGGGVLWGGKCGALNMCAQELRPLSKGKSSRAWGYETKDHDSWALLLRHHTNVAWHGVRSEYRLDNPVVLRNHHGRPGKCGKGFMADVFGKGFMVDVFVKINPTDPLRLVTDDFIIE